MESERREREGGREGGKEAWALGRNLVAFLYARFPVCDINHIPLTHTQEGGRGWREGGEGRKEGGELWGQRSAGGGGEVLERNEKKGEKVGAGQGKGPIAHIPALDRPPPDMLCDCTPLTAPGWTDRIQARKEE